MAILPGERSRGKYRPIVTTVIIVVNVLVYLYTSLASGSPFYASSASSLLAYGFKPVYIFTNPVEALIKAFSSMFVHADLFHIFFNMYFLWIFGSRLEGVLGPKNMLALYFISGLSATLFHTAFIPVGGYDALTTPAVGASGAISGILGMYLLMFPYTRLVMCTFFLLLPFCFSLPASAFLLIWFAQQVTYGYLRLGGVAYFAHIGGFVMGLLLTPLLAKGAVKKPRYLEHFYRYFAEVYGIRIGRLRGIGTGAKTVLALLLVAVMGGFFYGAYAAYTHSEPRLYALNLHVDVAGAVQEDQVLLGVSGSESAVFSQYIFTAEYPYDYIRVFLNRIMPMLYNTAYSDMVLYDRHYEYTVTVSGVPVVVKLYVNKAQYDGYGAVVYMTGFMDTSIVQMRSGRVESLREVRLNYTVDNVIVDTALLSALSLVAIAVCVFGLSAVLRGEEVAIILQFEERGLFPYV